MIDAREVMMQEVPEAFSPLVSILPHADGVEVSSAVKDPDGQEVRLGFVLTTANLAAAPKFMRATRQSLWYATKGFTPEWFAAEAEKTRTQ
jgi:hypothetical protein